MPVDLGDPLLRNWTKELSGSVKNPMQSMRIPPGGTHAQFRDPMTAWKVSSNELGGLLDGMKKIEEAEAAEAAKRRAAAAAGALSGNVSSISVSLDLNRQLINVTAPGMASPGNASSAGGGKPSAVEPVVIGQPAEGAAARRAALLPTLDSRFNVSKAAASGGAGSRGKGSSSSSGSGGEEGGGGEGRGVGGGDGDGEGGGGGGGGNSQAWMTAVGALDDCLGAAALYVSTDGFA